MSQDLRAKKERFTDIPWNKLQIEVFADFSPGQEAEDSRRAS